ncbi:MAG: hypothetical protein ACI8SE_001665 [Bacteroidia bacterium]
MLSSISRSALLTITILTLSTSVVKAQFFVETGLPQPIIGFSGGSFFQNHGWYAHVGHDFDKMSIHTKIYSDRVGYGNRTEHGVGLGVSRILTFEKIQKLSLNVGFGALYLEKRGHRYKYLDSNYPSIFIETQLRYYVLKQIYLSTELTYGYGRHYYVTSGTLEQLSTDVPYLLSFGVGYKFSKKEE